MALKLQKKTQEDCLMMEPTSGSSPTVNHCLQKVANPVSGRKGKIVHIDSKKVLAKGVKAWFSRIALFFKTGSWVTADKFYSWQEEAMISALSCAKILLTDDHGATIRLFDETVSTFVASLKERGLVQRSHFARRLAGFESQGIDDRISSIVTKQINSLEKGVGIYLVRWLIKENCGISGAKH